MSPFDRDPGRREQDLGCPGLPVAPYEHIRIFTKEIVGGRDLGQPGS